MLSDLDTMPKARWSLFLDRDGVINKRIIDDYVKNCAEFEFLPGVFDAFKIFSKEFERIFIVTNQQGVGKGWMTESQLSDIHYFMISEIEKNKGRVDAVYFSPHLEKEQHPMRKPGPGMALQAKKEFSELRFEECIMVGDSISDMFFGKRLGMKTVFISDDLKKCREHFEIIDFYFPSLFDFAKSLDRDDAYYKQAPQKR